MKLELQIDNKILKKDGQPFEMDVAPFTQNDRTFVPIRFVAENLGYTVGWDEKTQTVTITDEKPSKHKKYYDNPDDCAIDFAMCYMPLSIGIDREISMLISENENGYYYTNVYIGTETQCATQRKGHVNKSDGHTHADAKGNVIHDRFSNLDISSTKKKGMPFSYMISPYGNVQKYIVATGKTEIVSTQTPFDVRCIEKISKKYPEVAKNVEYFKEYFGNVIPSVDAEDNKYTTAHLSWCNEADKYIKEFWNKAVVV